MKDFTVLVKKLTGEDLLRAACESTFIGKSHASLLALYKAEHSPVRTQLFWITLKNIPLFVSTHLIRHHVGSVPFQLTCRDDRPGGNPGMIDKCTHIVNHLNDAMDCVEHEQSKAALSIIYDCIESVDWLASHADRYTPVNLSLLINAQSLIDIAKLRLCVQAHKETIEIFQRIKEEIAQIDPSLASMMVRKCVYRGGLCGEQRCCGFNHTPAFLKEWKEYASQFTEKQKGLLNNCLDKQ